MNPAQVRLTSLIAEVRRDWAQVKQHLDRARSATAAKGEAEAALAALSLDHAYQAFESMLLKIERALGLPERTGATWHAALLFDAGQPLEGIRPAVTPQETLGDWEALLGFRHFLRHAYAVPLDPARLRLNAERLARAVAATDPHIAALLSALAEDQAG